MRRPAPRFYPGDTVACTDEWEGDPQDSPQVGQLYPVRHLCWLGNEWFLLLEGLRYLWGESGFCQPADLPEEYLLALAAAEAEQNRRDAASIARRQWSAQPKKRK